MDYATKKFVYGINMELLAEKKQRECENKENKENKENQLLFEYNPALDIIDYKQTAITLLEKIKKDLQFQLKKTEILDPIKKWGTSFYVYGSYDLDCERYKFCTPYSFGEVNVKLSFGWTGVYLLGEEYYKGISVFYNHDKKKFIIATYKDYSIVRGSFNVYNYDSFFNRLQEYIKFTLAEALQNK